MPPCAKYGVGGVVSSERCKFFNSLHCIVYVASDLADLALHLKSVHSLAKHFFKLCSRSTCVSSHHPKLKTRIGSPCGNQPNQGDFPQTPGSKAYIWESWIHSFWTFFLFRWNYALSWTNNFAVLFCLRHSPGSTGRACRGVQQGRPWQGQGIWCNRIFPEKCMKSITKVKKNANGWNLDEGNNCIGENLTTPFLPWTWFGSIWLGCWWKWIRIRVFILNSRPDKDKIKIQGVFFHWASP